MINICYLWRLGHFQKLINYFTWAKRKNLSQFLGICKTRVNTGMVFPRPSPAPPLKRENCCFQFASGLIREAYWLCLQGAISADPFSSFFLQPCGVTMPNPIRSHNSDRSLARKSHRELLTCICCLLSLHRNKQRPKGPSSTHQPSPHNVTWNWKTKYSFIIQHSVFNGWLSVL